MKAAVKSSADLIVSLEGTTATSQSLRAASSASTVSYLVGTIVTPSFLARSVPRSIAIPLKVPAASFLARNGGSGLIATRSFPVGARSASGVLAAIVPVGPGVDELPQAAAKNVRAVRITYDATITIGVV